MLIACRYSVLSSCITKKATSRSSRRLLHSSTVEMRFWKPCCQAATLGAVNGFSSTTMFPYPAKQALPARLGTAKSVHTRLFSTANSDQQKNETTNSFATTYHAPVMWRECIDALLSCQRNQERLKGNDNDNDNNNNSPLLFVDATLGGGGHSAALLKELKPGDVVFGCDVDPTALQTASDRLAAYMGGNTELPTFVPVQSNFCDLASALDKLQHATTNEPLVNDGIDGILMDLGVSSHQIDTAERGFAFMKEGPLDMRMGQDTRGGLTAADICNEFDALEIKRILKNYGDEPRAKAIANAITERRPLVLTSDLVDAVAAVTPQFAKKGRRMGRTATLARVFQSLRIVVNREDAVLEKALTEMCPAVLRPGGRLVVMSYHSLEDRCTKRVIRDGTVERISRNDERDMYGNYNGTPKPFRSMGKLIKASDEEVELNPRARSATLRVAERQETN